MIKMRMSSEKGLARSETRKGRNQHQPALEAAGLELVQKAAASTYLSHASQLLLKRVFLWARFHLTARKRLQVRNPCTGLLVSVTRDISVAMKPLRPGLKPRMRQPSFKAWKSGPNGMFPDADSKSGAERRDLTTRLS